MDKRPRPSWWYEKEPFDPNLTVQIDGLVTRYMDSPRSEEYIFEPIDRFVERGLPPEEREVRDYLLVAHLLRTRVTGFEFWWSQLVRETEHYKKCRRAFKNLEALCGKSPEHRAAFLRMANGDVFPPKIRFELKKMVVHQDNVLRC